MNIIFKMCIWAKTCQSIWDTRDWHLWLVEISSTKACLSIFSLFKTSIRASPMQESNYGSQDSHVSQRSKFLTRIFHNFRNSWHLKMKLFSRTHFYPYNIFLNYLNNILKNKKIKLIKNCISCLARENAWPFSLASQSNCPSISNCQLAERGERWLRGDSWGRGLQVALEDGSPFEGCKVLPTHKLLMS